MLQSPRGKPAWAQAASLAYSAVQRQPVLLPLAQPATSVGDISQATLPQAKPCTCTGSLFNGQIIQCYVAPDIFTPFSLQENLREGTVPSISSSRMCEVPLESTLHLRWQ